MAYTVLHEVEQNLKDIHSLINDLFLIPVSYTNVLYIHAPFCFKRCSFCAYSSLVPSNGDEIRNFYENILPGQVEFYSGVLKTAKFQQVFFGGGTPNLISGVLLDQMFSMLSGFKRIPQKMFEVNPWFLTDEHIEVLKKWDFTLISMGVQTLNRDVLKKNNRDYVGVEKLRAICSSLHGAGIMTSMDLLALINRGDISDLEQVRDDLDKIMSDVCPTEIVLHINYRQELPVSLLSEIIKLIREMIGRYPEYQCVNSLLTEAEAAKYYRKYPAFRLMRKNQSYTFYMQPLIPRPGTDGHNMLAIGHYKGINLITDYLDNSFYLSQKHYKVRTCDSNPQYFEKKKNDYLEYQKIRRQLGLYYAEIPDSPFYNSNDYETYKKIIGKLAKYI
ncbi:MAG: radical SAM protein [Eubacteriales bacterium]